MQLPKNFKNLDLSSYHTTRIFQKSNVIQTSTGRLSRQYWQKQFQKLKLSSYQTTRKSQKFEVGHLSNKPEFQKFYSCCLVFHFKKKYKMFTLE